MEVERLVCSCIDNDGSLRRDAVESRRRTRAKVHVQGIGVVWRHGGIVASSTGLPKIMRILTLKMAQR
jgi:hypothetical protein